MRSRWAGVVVIFSLALAVLGLMWSRLGLDTTGQIVGLVTALVPAVAWLLKWAASGPVTVPSPRYDPPPVAITERPIYRTPGTAKGRTSRWFKAALAVVVVIPVAYLVIVNLPRAPLIIIKTESLDMTALEFHGDMLMAADRNGKLLLWNVSDRMHPSLTWTTTVDHYVRDATVSPDGKLLAVGGNSDSVLIFDIAGAEPTVLATIGGFTKSSTVRMEIAFSPDGSTLATTSTADPTRMYGMEKPNRPVLLSTLDSRSGTPAHGAVFSPDGATLVLASDVDSEMWDVRDRTRPKFIRAMKSLGGTVTDAVYSTDGSWLTEGLYDGEIRQWYFHTVGGDFVGPGKIFERDGINALAYGSKGRRIAAAYYDGTVEVFAQEEPWRETFKIHSPVTAVAFNAEGTLLAFAGDEKIFLYDF